MYSYGWTNYWQVKNLVHLGIIFVCTEPAYRTYKNFDAWMFENLASKIEDKFLAHIV